MAANTWPGHGAGREGNFRRCAGAPSTAGVPVLPHSSLLRMTDDMSDDPGRTFLDLSARFLQDELFPRLAGAVRRLDGEDLWWRPNEASNSVGNLVLHLAGNLRQWVVSGVGGAPDERRREEEFQARGGWDADEVLATLEEVVERAASVLREADPGEVLETRTIQGMDVTAMEAVYHAVEHFSMHTGQILWIVKLRSGEDLGFYRIRDGTAERRW